MRKILRLTIIAGVIGAVVNAFRRRSSSGDEGGTQEVHGDPSAASEVPGGHTYTSGASEPAPEASAASVEVPEPPKQEG